MFYDKSLHGHSSKDTGQSASSASNVKKATVDKPGTDGQAVCRLAHLEVRDIQRRNYLLRPVGLELFMADGLNHLLIFHKSEREVVIEKMMQVSVVCFSMCVCVCIT
jgi:hypothetical protein